MKKYTIKANGQLHEAVELEIEHYRYLYECGVEEGEVTEEAAEGLREKVDKLWGIMYRALRGGVLGAEIGILKEVAASRAIRQDKNAALTHRKGYNHE